MAVRRARAWPWAAVLLLAAAVFWSFWPTLVALFRDWQHDQDYSVGQLVPLVVLYLLWRGRSELGRLRVAPCWWGLPLLLAAQAAHIYGLVDLRESIERYAIVLTVVALVLLVFGRSVFWRLKWALLFLLLMVPLPGQLHNLISGPLQNLATASAVFMLEVFGVQVSREGNVMMLNGSVPVAVAEACSGLRMLTAFVVVAASLAFVVRRPPWQRGVLVLSSVPIAIFCNLVRLVVTALMFMWTSSEAAERFFHDFAGLAMMPPAVLILAGELWFMKKVVIDESRQGAAEARGTKPKLSSTRAGGEKLS